MSGTRPSGVRECAAIFTVNAAANQISVQPHRQGTWLAAAIMAGARAHPRCTSPDSRGACSCLYRKCVQIVFRMTSSFSLTISLNGWGKQVEISFLCGTCHSKIRFGALASTVAEECTQPEILACAGDSRFGRSYGTMPKYDSRWE